MNRYSAVAIAATLFAGPASAATYSASIETSSSGRIIARDISWRCVGTTCQGATDYGRPVVLCQSLAKKVGKVKGFAVNGRALNADKLAECNALAKDIGSDLARAH